MCVVYSISVGEFSFFLLYKVLAANSCRPLPFATDALSLHYANLEPLTADGDRVQAQLRGARPSILPKPPETPDSGTNSNASGAAFRCIRVCLILLHYVTMVQQIYNEGQRYIIPTSDWGFKRLFGSEINKGLLIGLLNRIIDDRVIEDLEYLDRDVFVPVGSVRRMSFDVYCRCADGSRVIVEMQNYAKTSFVERTLVYTSASILENYTYSKGRDYHVEKTYLIAITGEAVFPKVDHAPVRLAMCDMDAPDTTVLNDKILHIFIELPKFADSLEDLGKDASFLNKFAVAMKTMSSFGERPKEMDDAMLVQMFDAADLLGYKAKDKHNYKKSVMNEFEYEETLKEYRQEGLEEGREEGRAEGREEGRKLGLEEGRIEERRRSAAKYKSLGVSVDIIAQVTGLSPEEIQAL